MTLSTLLTLDSRFADSFIFRNPTAFLLETFIRKIKVSANLLSRVSNVDNVKKMRILSRLFLYQILWIDTDSCKKIIIMDLSSVLWKETKSNSPCGSVSHVLLLYKIEFKISNTVCVSDFFFMFCWL